MALLVVPVLLLLRYLASRRLRLGWKVNVACYLLSSAMFAAIVLLVAK